MSKIQALNTCINDLRGGPAVPPTPPPPKFVRPLASHVGTIFRSWALLGRILRLLLRLLLRLAGFCASWSAPGSILDHFWFDFAGFWPPKTMIFEVFSRRAAATAVMLWMQQNHSFIGSEHTSQGTRSTQKTTKNRFQSLAHAALCPKALLATLGGTIAALWGCICELLGRSWVTFGRPWRPKSWFWDALGRLSSASWTLLGVSWLHLRPYGHLQASFCRVSGALDLDFGGFMEPLAWILECLLQPAQLPTRLLHATLLLPGLLREAVHC